MSFVEEGDEREKDDGKLTETETVSFSLTIGTTPMDSSSVKVLTAFK